MGDCRVRNEEMMQCESSQSVCDWHMGLIFGIGTARALGFIFSDGRREECHKQTSNYFAQMNCSNNTELKIKPVVCSHEQVVV